jgi:hypothetical protein
MITLKKGFSSNELKIFSMDKLKEPNNKNSITVHKNIGGTIKPQIKKETHKYKFLIIVSVIMIISIIILSFTPLWEPLVNYFKNIFFETVNSTATHRGRTPQ